MESSRPWNQILKLSFGGKNKEYIALLHGRGTRLSVALGFNVLSSLKGFHAISDPSVVRVLT